MKCDEFERNLMNIVCFAFYRDFLSIATDFSFALQASGGLAFKY